MTQSAATTFETEDLALAAYLLMNKIEMNNYEQSGNKVCFKFQDKEGECKKLHVKFLNSECKRFDSFVRDLKKIWK